MVKTLLETNFKFPKQTNFYRGKVRDIYTIEGDILIMIVTDRISAFDVVLPKGIPYKGQVLNQIAAKFLDLTAQKVPNWKIAVPDPMVMIGRKCKPFPVEMIVRAYLTGSAWRAYKNGQREISGVKIPEGMKENQKFEKPILTPTTKAQTGHDQNISKEQIISQGLVSEKDYEIIEKYSFELFKIGSEYAQKRGLILVDTKYEFGKCNDGTIVLVDEVHTPDSSRYFYADDYQQRFEKREKPRQLSKEFVRQYLIDNGFMGRPEDKMPPLPDDFIDSVSKRYIELFEKITADKFKLHSYENIEKRIYENVLKFLDKI